MPNHDLDIMEETFLDQQELLVHNKQTVDTKMKGSQRFVKTIALSMAFFCLGLCIAIPGPTLIELGRRVSRDTEHMTFIFTARSVGFLIGSLVGGILFDFFDQQILLFYTLAFVAVATAGVPWCSALLTLSTLICLQGVAIGVLDTGGNVFCIKIWGKRSAPFMQVLHFAFGVGAFLAPLLARPFLIDAADISDNATLGGYHPVNIKVPSMLSRSTNDNRFIRDVSNLQFWNQDYAFKPDTLSTRNFTSEKSGEQILTNSTGQDQINNVSSSFWHKNHLFTKRNQPNKKHVDGLINEKEIKSLFIVPVKWKHFKVGRLKRSLVLGNESEFLLNKTVQNVTSIILTSSTPARVHKPVFNSGDHLSKDNANAALADAELKSLRNKLNNLEQEKEEAGIVPSTGIITTGHYMNGSSETVMSERGTVLPLTSENPIHSTQNWTNSGNLSVIGTAEVKATVPESTSTSAPTTIATTPTTTATTSTTTTSTATTPTTTPDTTPTTTPDTTPTTTPDTMPNSTLTTSSTTITVIESTRIPAQTTSSVIMSAEDLATAMTNSTRDRSSIIKPETTGDIITDLVATLAGMSRIQFAYTIIGLLLAINASMFLFLHCKDRALKTPLYPRRYRDQTRSPYTKCFVASVILLLFFFFLAYMGMEATFGGLLATFAVHYPIDPWTPAQGATLTALFWGCLALGRGFSIFIAGCVKPSNMMALNLCLTVFGAMILSFGVPASSAVLWVGTVTLGLGVSSLFPTAISWADSCYPLSGRATAVFVAGCGVGEMSVPVLTGYLYENISHMAVMYVTLFLSCLLFILYLSIQLLVYRKGKSSQRRSHTGFMQLKDTEEVCDESDIGVVEGITLGVTETTWRRRVQGEEERRRENLVGNKISEFTKLMEM